MLDDRRKRNKGGRGTSFIPKPRYFLPRGQKDSKYLELPTNPKVDSPYRRFCYPTPSICKLNHCHARLVLAAVTPYPITPIRVGASDNIHMRLQPRLVISPSQSRPISALTRCRYLLTNPGFAVLPTCQGCDNGSAFWKCVFFWGRKLKIPPISPY